MTRLITIARKAQSVPQRDREALVSSLGWLKKESITTSGVLLMRDHLKGRLHAQSQSAAYKLSTVTHGRVADRAEIDRIAGLVFQVVGDLLSGNLLTLEPKPD